MNTGRPWLTHGIAFDVTDTQGGDRSAGAPAGGAPAGLPSLESLLKQHPHIEAELTGRTQRIASKEKEQGERTALQRWAQQLGVTDGNVEVVAEAYRRHSEQQAAAMSEADRAKADREKDRADAARALEEAKQARFEALAIKHLSKANAEAPEIMAASLARFGVDLDADEDAISKAVEEMKKVLPGSFGGKASGTPQAGPGKPPASTPQGRSTGEDKKGAQAAAHLERRANRVGKAPIPGQ